MMGENEINEIQNLSDDDLLTLNQKVLDHLNYLNSSLIDTSVEIEGGEIENE